MTPAISLTGLTRRYRDNLALDDVTVDIEGPSITGLLGRNGAGKTTLLRIIAAQELVSAGRVQVFGASPLENDAVLRRIVLVREDQAFPDFKVRHALRAASWFYPNWSPELAEALVGEFDLPTDRAIKRLSRGMRTAAGALIATWADAWKRIGHFFTTLSAAGLTAVLAVVAAALLAGAFTTMRRVTV